MFMIMKMTKQRLQFLLTMTTREPDKNIVDERSMVNRLRILLKESGELEVPSPQKTLLVFQALDQVTEHVGVFKEVIKEIRNELVEAVYSNQITSTVGPEEPLLRRVPYYDLIRRIEKVKDDKADELTGQLQYVQQKLFAKQKDYEKVIEDMATLTATMDKLQGKAADLKETIEKQKEEYVELQKNVEKKEREFKKKEKNLNDDINDLKEELDAVIKERDVLRPYMEGYSKLEKAFTVSESDRLENQKRKKKSVVSTKRAHLISNIEAAMKLEEQILFVQNRTLEDFDRTLETHRRQIALCSAPSDPEATDIAEPVTEADAEQADLDLLKNQSQFTGSCALLEEELVNLKLHTTMLKEQLQELEENKNKGGQHDDAKRLFAAIAKGGKGKPISEDELMDDPFVVHERVFSKYAAMIYTSTNHAKSFSEVREASYCFACGEKTVVCPHKMTKEERVISLPLSCTHIKVSRPKVKINQEIVDKALGILSTVLQRQPTSATSETVPTEAAPSIPGTPAPSAVAATPATPTTSRSRKTSRSVSVMGGTPGSVASEESVETDSTFKNSFNVIWEDFQARYMINRSQPRTIDATRVISLVEQFWASVLWDDDHALKDEQINCISNKFYDFMEQRFIVPKVAALAISDFITELMVELPNSQVLRCFAHIMVNNLDGSVFRYMLLLCDLIDSFQWSHTEQVRHFLTVVYPFLGEDDIETLQIGFVSFCENKVSKKTIANYINYILLKYREPQFLEMETRLMQTSNIGGCMNVQDFTGFMESMLVTIDERLAKHLFREALQANAMDGIPEGLVPVQKLAQIGSYLSLYQSLESMRSDLKTRLQKVERRKSLFETETSSARTESKTSENLKWTYANLYNLADDISRSLAFRQQMSK